MTGKVHINSKGEPKPCHATKRPCQFDRHFESMEDAQRFVEQQLKKDHRPLVSLKSVEKLNRQFEQQSYEDVSNFANSSEASLKQLENVIDVRIAESERRSKELEDHNPYKKSKNPMSFIEYRKAQKDFDTYRDRTALMVEAQQESVFHKPSTTELDVSLPLGTSIPTTNYSHEDPRWYTSRFNTIGGSDVGYLAVNDFTPDDKKSVHDRRGFRNLEESKTNPPDIDEISKNLEESKKDENRTGALYRGTVWEDRIRDDFAKDHDELTVYKTKGQYCHKDREWQNVNFDGVLSDRKDGKPNGILEIKTGGNLNKWKDGIPLNYRAQTLYYLNATGYDFAYVRVCLNDHESRDYRLSKDDEVAPGSGITMQEYIDDRVFPWFDELKEKKTTAN